MIGQREALSGSKQSKDAQTHLLFGRGFIAGVDRREQKKSNAQHEDGLREKLRGHSGLVQV